MKTIKIITLALLVAANIACNNDDDASNAEKDYFPTQISTVTPGATNASNMNIQYDSSNRISQFSYTEGSETNSYNISHNSEGVITSILHTRPDATTLNYSYGYANGRVSQLTLTNASSSFPLEVNYNEFANTYTIFNGSSNLIFTYDASGNITDINPGFGNFLFTYNSNEGIYKNISDNLPLVLVLSLGGSGSDLINSFLFSNKQLTSMSVIGSNLNIETTRDENNQIATVKVIDPTSSEIQSTATITYELRTIN